MHAQTYSRTKTIDYEDNLSSWVLGQTKRVTLNGIEVSRVDYDASTALPIAKYQYGELKESYTYSADGTLASAVDGLGHVTYYKNYEHGVATRIEFPPTQDQPSGTVVNAEVSVLGDVTSVTDAAGNKTCYSYDALGRINLIKYPSKTTAGVCGGSWNDTSITFSPDAPAGYGLPAGMWRQRIVTGDEVSESIFDGLWRPVIKQTYDSNNKAASISQRVIRYDNLGRVAFSSYPQRSLDSTVTDTWADTTKVPDALGTHSEYDALGRTTSVTQDSEQGVLVKTTTKYLPGFQTQITDPNQNVTTVSYMTYGEPSTDWPVAINAPENVLQTIVRNIYGNPVSITQSGGGSSVTKYWFYDDYQRLCRLLEPESGSTVTDYDAADNIVWSASGQNITGTGCGRDQVDSSSKITRSYDALNRLMAVSYPDATNAQAYTYDARSNVATETNGLTMWSYVHDSRNNLKSEVLSEDGYVWPFEYKYDDNGNVESTTYPDGKVINFNPDPLGRPTQAGSYATDANYLADGSLNSFIYQGGIAYLADQNERDLVKNISYGAASGAVIYSQEFSYDANGNITKATDLSDTQGRRDKNMTYDGLNRLKDASAPNLWGDESYAYDALNNISTMTNNGVGEIYNYDSSNRLISVATGGSALHNFVYDDRGNMIQKDGTSLVFDLADRLKQITGVANYDYDASGRRVKKINNNGDITYYGYSSAGKLMWQYVPTTTTTGTGSDYVYLRDKLIAKLDHDVSRTVPEPVASVSVPSASAGSISVQWPTSTYAMSYSVDQQLDGGTWTAVYSGEALSTVKSESAGGSYVFRVAACNPVGCSNYITSAASTVSPQAAPSLAVPGGTNTSGSYTVSWGSAAGATTYILDEQVSGGSWSQIYSGAGSSTAIAGKVNGTYGYRVQAYNSGGYGPWSGTVNQVVLHPPAAPASISVPSTSSGALTVSWSSSSTATSYTLQHQKNGGAWSTIFSGSATSKAISETSTGSYNYRAQACNAAGCSAYKTSGAVTVTIPPSSAPSLSVPSGTNGSGSYSVGWTSVSGATSYTLQEQVNGGSWSTVYSGASTNKSTSGKANGTYSYRVRASNVGGNGPWSSTKTVRVVHAPPQPTSVNIVQTTSGSTYNFLGVWASVSGATYYEVYSTQTYGIIYSGANTSTVVESEPYGYKNYSQKVRACNAGGCSAWVNFPY
ncbi:hypothetical protein [Oleiagrimonas soli]|uniref:Fibronectin type-III domain-containing protein n=1 Tax=Oleiagrimonas soli TaxID=1543381 RepID=A0A841KI53_9GAMM|nr:hypothetical protein [Oleiagrimonas soli]MBB6184650.1 hypothetical protein [Oleiagrimonas soli]